MDKKSRKQRQKAEQAYKQEATPSVVEKMQSVEPGTETPTQTEVDDIEVWDYDQLREDYGW